MSANKRKERIDLLSHSIKLATQHNGCASMKLTIAQYGYEWGTSDRTMKDYIQQLERLGRLKIQGDEITHFDITETPTEEVFDKVIGATEGSEDE